jgi:hypothetical protein
MSEPDEAIAAQLECLYRAFCFYHGSFKRVKQSCGGERKRLSSTLTRIWTSLISYFRPPRDVVHSAFRPIPFLGLLQNANRHYAMSSQPVTVPLFCSLVWLTRSVGPHCDPFWM